MMPPTWFSTTCRRSSLNSSLSRLRKRALTPTEMSCPTFSSSVIFLSSASAHLSASFVGRRGYGASAFTSGAAGGGSCARPRVRAGGASVSEASSAAASNARESNAGFDFFFIPVTFDSVGRARREFVAALGRGRREGEASGPRDRKSYQAAEQHVPGPRERRPEPHVEH